MWCFTIHGQLEELVDLLDAMAPPKWGDYGKCQLEQCPETARYHLQGFLVFPRRQRLSALKKIHATAHREASRGSLESNEAYCSKETTRVPNTETKTWGIRPNVGQGKRTDLDDACELLKATQGTVRQ